MADLSQRDSDSFYLRLTPAGAGFRVVVMTSPDRYGVATSVEESDYRAAVIGVALYHTWKESRSNR